MVIDDTSGRACSFWQKVLMAALSKVLVQVTEQSILRWMGECERQEGERGRHRGRDRKVISIFRSRLLIYNSCLAERAHVRTDHLHTCNYGSFVWTEWRFFENRYLPRKYWARTHTFINKVLYPEVCQFFFLHVCVFFSFFFLQALNCVICSATWSLAYFEMPCRLSSIKRHLRYKGLIVALMKIPPLICVF